SWVSSPAETEMFEHTLDAFRAAEPEVAFDFEPIPGNYSEKLQLMLGTNTGPDLFYLKGYIAPSFMSFDILEPLDSYTAAEPDINLDDFYPTLLAAFQRDGVQYGLPKDFAPYVMFYNLDLLAQAGLDSVPTTWEELEQYATALTQDTDGDGETDTYGLVIEPSTEMLMPFVFQNGGAFQNTDGSLGITDEPFIEALEFYHGLYASGKATIPTDVGQGWNGDTFGRAKAAICFSGGWLIPFLRLNYPDLNWAVAPLPQGKTRATVAFTTAFAMPKSSAYKQDAWKAMHYLTGTEGMRIWT
ncbi:MAG TPA: ABC transporter substrate-binding protein, partial [Cytophagales bacterium]|nr:ABC transporter substrate-binding protein [Cytophagales bacterium]